MKDVTDTLWLIVLLLVGLDYALVLLWMLERAAKG